MSPGRVNRPFSLLKKELLVLGGGVLIYFSVRGRAAEQGIIFRIPTRDRV